jgi:hypothetical protein
MLRLGKQFTKDERIQRVDEVLHFVCNYFSKIFRTLKFFKFQLNLTKSENTTIGIPGIVKGLSGGEKRRLIFATEVWKSF